MADLIQAPFLRNQYNPSPTYRNPVWIGDVVAANQALLTMLQLLGGFDPTTDFALLWGFAYTAGSPGTYGPGLFYLNGNFYFQSTTFNENLRLIPNVTGTMPYTYPDDLVSRNTYNINYSQTGTGATQTPLFATGGNMAAYRMDLKTTAKNLLPVVCLNEQQAHLGTGYAVQFIEDKNVFFNDAVSNATITFNMTGAVVGCVVTLRWTFSGSETLSITAPAGGELIKESGVLSLAGNNANILNIMYGGLNSAGNPSVRYTLNQTA